MARRPITRSRARSRDHHRGHGQGDPIDAVFHRIAQVVIVGWTIWIFLALFADLPDVAVRSVQVEGARAAPKEEIQALAATRLSGTILGIPRANALFAPRTSLVHDLPHIFGRVKSARANVHGDVLVISVAEREPASLWCRMGESDASTTMRTACAFVDENGVIFANAPVFEGHLYFTYITNATSSPASVAARIEGEEPLGRAVLPAPVFASVTTLRDLLGQAGYSAYSVTELSDGDMRVELSAPWHFLWNVHDDPAVIVSRLVAAVGEMTKRGSHPTEIDLRFGNKVFYRS